MESLISRHRRLLAGTSTAYIRNLMNTIHWNNRLVAIRGARGVGKTTLMLQYLKLNFPIDGREAFGLHGDFTGFTRPKWRM